MKMLSRLSVEAMFDGPIVAVTASTTEAVFDMALANKFMTTIGADDTVTLTLVNDAGNQAFSLIISQTESGSGSVVWWEGIRWPGGSAPALTLAANALDLFSFIRLGSGDYLGMAVQNFAAA